MGRGEGERVPYVKEVGMGEGEKLLTLSAKKTKSFACRG